MYRHCLGSRLTTAEFSCHVRSHRVQALCKPLNQKFITTLSNSLGSKIYYSTYFGKDGGDYDIGGIAVDKSLNIYLTGATNGDIPTTSGALFRPGTKNDLFVSKLVIMDDLALGVSASSSSVVHGDNLTYTIAVTSKGPDFASNLRIDDPLPTGTTLVGFDAGSSSRRYRKPSLCFASIEQGANLFR